MDTPTDLLALQAQIDLMIKRTEATQARIRALEMAIEVCDMFYLTSSCLLFKSYIGLITSDLTSSVLMAAVCATGRRHG